MRQMNMNVNGRAFILDEDIWGYSIFEIQDGVLKAISNHETYNGMIEEFGEIIKCELK